MNKVVVMLNYQLIWNRISSSIAIENLHLVGGGTYLPKLRVHLAHGEAEVAAAARAVGKCCCGS